MHIHACVLCSKHKCIHRKNVRDCVYARTYIHGHIHVQVLPDTYKHEHLDKLTNRFKYDALQIYAHADLFPAQREYACIKRTNASYS
jgi:hypothetical protein